MAVFSLVAALLLDHLAPKPAPDPLERLHTVFTRGVSPRLPQPGQAGYGLGFWLLTVLPVGIVAGLIGWGLGEIASVLGWLWGVAVLYACLGLRGMSDQASETARALREGRLEEVRSRFPAAGEGADEATLARLAVESVLTAAMRRLFGVAFWFVLLGPAGAVLYRLTTIAPPPSNDGEAVSHDGHDGHAALIRRVADWVPARLTALSFAVAGNFEDALVCWRTQAERWGDPEVGGVIAAGGGALGLRLGQPVGTGEGAHWRPEMGCGQEVDADCIDAAVSLVWRALIIWLAVGLFIVIGGWVA